LAHILRERGLVVTSLDQETMDTDAGINLGNGLDGWNVSVGSHGGVTVVQEVEEAGKSVWYTRLVAEAESPTLDLNQFLENVATGVLGCLKAGGAL
jgi:hypothetical protein